MVPPPTPTKAHLASPGQPGHCPPPAARGEAGRDAADQQVFNQPQQNHRPSAITVKPPDGYPSSLQRQRMQPQGAPTWHPLAGRMVSVQQEAPLQCACQLGGSYPRLICHSCKDAAGSPKTTETGVIITPSPLANGTAPSDEHYRPAFTRPTPLTPIEQVVDGPQALPDQARAPATGVNAA